VSLLSETIRVVGIIGILFLVGTVRVFFGRISPREQIESAAFALAAVFVILTADYRFVDVGSTLLLIGAWGTFLLFSPSVAAPWLRDWQSEPLRPQVKHLLVRTIQISLATGLMIWVFLVLTDRGNHLQSSRYYVAAIIGVLGAIQLARLPRVAPPPAVDESEQDKVPVGS
jgi:hypothetical protein